MSVAISHKWRPIKNLPDPKSLDSDLSADEKERQWGGELLSLIQVWTDQREELEKSVGLALFYKQLKRQWAIETGVLERLYTLDRGVTQLLRTVRGASGSGDGHATGRGRDRYRTILAIPSQAQLPCQGSQGPLRRVP